MTYLQTFIKPAETEIAWNGFQYIKLAKKTELPLKAKTPQQAYMVARSMAKQHGWAVSGKAVRVN